MDETPPQEHDITVNSGSIFISYAREDREVARQLVHELKKRGINVWWDEDGIQWGDHWIQKVQVALSQCSAYVILYGRHGERRWVGAELTLALQRHYEQDLPILPLLLDNATVSDLPPFLSVFQARTLNKDTDYQALAKYLLLTVDNTIEQRSQISHSRCPYPGLTSFNEDQADLFFGRQSETVDALGKLGMGIDRTYRRWLLVEGPSGVGKSSFVKAGILPAIKRGWFDNKRDSSENAFGHSDVTWQGLRWVISPPMRPGDRPLVNLADALHQSFAHESGRCQSGKISETEIYDKLVPESNHAGQELTLLLREYLPEVRFLLVIDQFEELFTLTRDTAERNLFDGLLSEALHDCDGGLHLITIIRSDFMNRFAELTRLSVGINDRIGRYYLEPMKRAGLRDVILTPAQMTNLNWSEPSLPDRILEQAVLAGRGALPLLSNLLNQLWHHRVQNRLNAEEFQRLGGVGGALAKSADGLLTSLENTEKNASEDARQILLALVNTGRESADTRRVVSETIALHAAGGEKARWVLERLSGLRDRNTPHDSVTLRLVNVWQDGQTTSTTKVELAHEALLGYDADGNPYWPTLRQWVEQQRDLLEKRDLLESLAKAWHQEGEPRFRGLITGNQLKDLAEVRDANETAATLLKRSIQMQMFKRFMALLSLVLVVALAVWVREQPGISPQHVLAYCLDFFDVYHKEPDLVDIQPGSFMMGANADDNTDLRSATPRHQVVFNYGFSIGKYEVSFDEYDRFAYATNRRLPDDQGWGRGDRPVINVDFQDALAYAQWLSENTGNDYRLPTEAEWEYATRAGSTSNYWWGDEFDATKANCNMLQNQLNNKGTVSVSELSANPWGLYHVHGNVWEWVSDSWHDSYEGAPTDGSSWEDKRTDYRLLRGGSWYYSPDKAQSALRLKLQPSVRGYDVGFRVVLRKSKREQQDEKQH